MAVLVLLIAMNRISFGSDIDSYISEHENYIAELLIKSKKLNLADDLYWHSILHYKKNLTGGYTSLVDDPKFFFSENGKNNPDAELDATIRGLFRPVEDGKIHPAAKFLARYAWLKEKLNIDVSKLPYDGEIQFSQFYKEINPSSVTLVFPAGFMNSPASMYGHTLLLIESEGSSRLLARAANYAAITDETFGPIFAFKGLFGLYKGYYSFLPYYQKIKEYSDGEMRDMWEYEISMTPAEIERLLRHVVEMEDIYSDYYFIDENCSFNLLYLIEAAKPETEITSAFGIGVEPIDTLRAVKAKNIVSKIVYRPSNYSKIQHLRSKLSSKEQKLILEFCKGNGDIAGIDSIEADEEKKIIMCDLASDYLKFMAEKNDISEQDYRSRFMSVLSKRNSLGKYDPLKDIPAPVGPEDSHLSRRLAPETGYGLNGLYSQISYRQSCHELMDPDEGYNMNSEIIFGNVTGRYYYEDKKFVLQKFDVIDIVSLPASDSFYISPCYEFKTGFIQNVNEDKNSNLTYWLKAGSGLSTLLSEKVQIYLIADLKSYFSPEYEYNSDFMAGAETGIFTILGPWKNHLYAQAYHAPFGEEHTRLTAGVSERIKITRSVSAMADYSYNRDYDFNWHEVSARVNFYF